MNLQSMTAFVLHESSKIYNSSVFADKVINYAKFLSRPLELWMFVPCDYEGNIWEYPPTQEEWDWATKDSADAEWGFKQKEFFFTKAKERVLFEGFESVDTRNDSRVQVKLLNANISGSSDTIQNDFAGLYFFDSRNEKSRLKTIEDLLKFHPINLTPTAIKEINP